MSSSLSVGAQRQESHRAFIALGSNLGNRIENIENGLDAMRSKGLVVKKVSNLYETKAMYYEDQGDFLNGVCLIETDLEPLPLLNTLQAIEIGLGRKKLFDKGPRNIDLDILLYDLIQFEHERLQIPHKLMHERWFVLQPFFEVCPPDYFPASDPLRNKYNNAVQALQVTLGSARPLAVSALSSTAPLVKPNDPFRSTQVMAILNLTPDSFSDGGAHDYNSLSEIEVTVRRFVADGATIVDIGGQSTRPNATLLSPEEELSRILPAIKHIRSLPEANNLLISIDTFYSKVAYESVAAGADIVNDISGGLMDGEMFKTMAALNKTIIIMHMRGTPETMTSMTKYPSGLLNEVATELVSRVGEALEAGIPRWRIVLDPGIGFAKTQSQNLELLRRFDELRQHPNLRGFSWLVGTSRKRFIGRITGVQHAKERQWGTAAALTASVGGGADIVRVHDVAEMVQVTKMANAIYRQQLPDKTITG